MNEMKTCDFCGGPIPEDQLIHNCESFLKQRNAELTNKVQRMIADNALHAQQYNAGVEAAKAGVVCGPRPEFDTSTYYDGYAATMLPVLRERISELEAALSWYADEKNYQEGYYEDERYSDSRVSDDRGERARNVLKGGE
jgi:hypothetical protein